jgi:hypothetical protein
MLGTRVTREEWRQLISESAAEKLIELPDSVIAEHYNRRGFIVSHSLADHPLTCFPALRSLAKRLHPQQIKYRAGQIPGDAEFDSAHVRYRGSLTREEAIDLLVERNVWLAIYNPERDSAYARLVRQLVAQIAAAIAPIDGAITWYSAYFFLSAQNSVTPYHADREMNFLLQIEGRKLVKLWDGMDDSVMSSRERDHLLAVPDQRPAYRPELDALAGSFHIAPGTGVHHPFIAPHLVVTESDLSISLAMTFRTERSDRWTTTHNVNHGMRRFGLNPRPVRKNSLVDSAKVNLAGSVRTLRRAWDTVRGDRTAL